MPQELIGTYDCPHIYYDEIAIAYEAEFCDLDDKRCKGTECEILKEIRKRR